MDHILTLDRSLVSLIHYCPACGALTRPAPSFLTMTELEVLQAVADGLSTADIARLRGVSDKAIDYTKHRLCRKLGIQRGACDVTVMLTRAALKLGVSRL